MGKRGSVMTKADIIEKVHKKVGFSKLEISSIVECVFDIIKETLQREDKIVISKFGNFIVRNKRLRRGRNPQTGGPLEISPRRVLTFKSSGVLRSNLRTSEETSGSEQG